MKQFHSIALVLTLIVAGCSGHSSSALPAGTTNLAGALSPLPMAKLTVHTSSNRLHRQDWGGIPTFGLLTLMDAPPLLGGVEPSEVDLAIVRIDAIGDAGPVTLAQFDTPYVLNVLDFQTQPVAFSSVPVAPGNYGHIQLTIDTSLSHVVLGGKTLPINFQTNLPATPDETMAGVTGLSSTSNLALIDLKSAMNAVAGQTNGFNIDFNAAESLTLADDGSVQAKPELAAAGSAQGSLSGQVLNASGNPVSHAIVVARDSSGLEANSAVTDAAGNFYIHTLEPGTYSLRIYNTYHNAAGTTDNATGQTSTEPLVFGPSATVQSGYVVNVGSLTD